MRNQYTLERLVRELQDNFGDPLAAARATGVSLMFVNQWAKDDEKVREALMEAERVGNQGLVSAAIRRGVHGVEKGVYYKGVKVDTETQYSDSLLTTLLKAKVPEFAKDAEGGGGTTVNVNVANLMPRADNYEQWLLMKQQTITGPVKDDVQPVDAEFADVTPKNVFAGVDL